MHHSPLQTGSAICAWRLSATSCIRVARSQIHALTTLGVPEVTGDRPKTLMPTSVEKLGVHVYHDMNQGLKDVDVVIMLRLQNERMNGALLPSAQEFFKYYGLTLDKLGTPTGNAIVMHPGPMNRGVEIGRRWPTVRSR